VRIVAVVLLALSLAACNRGTQNQEAVRQGVIDHLAKGGFNMQAMDVNITSVDYKGDQADASVTIGLKGNAAQGMSRKYHLERKGSQWVVTNSQDAGGAHGGAAMPPAGGGMPPAGGGMPPAAPGAENPHGAMPGGGGKMPSPEDLPPSGKKK
jgi:hypothetical protein